MVKFNQVHSCDLPRETYFSKGWGVKPDNRFKNYIYFKAGARCKAGFQVSLLSNLARGEMFEFEGRSFLTAEHAYMAQRVDVESRERFTINGDLGCFDNMKNNKKTLAWWMALDMNKTKKNKDINFWDLHKMDGQIAKAATKEQSCKILGIKIITKMPAPAMTADNKNEEEHKEWRLWKNILLAKFRACDDARNVLLASDKHLLIETARFQPQGSKWGGLVKDGVLLGDNKMGRYLCRVRSIIQNKIQKKAEEAKAQEAKAQEPKTEEPKAQEPKAEEPKDSICVIVID
jgi:predicted NAD-dependent protein-ADP-ribosyltransferase YbiA (DUF1768 family)